MRARLDMVKNVALFGGVIFLFQKYGHKLAV